MDGKDVMLIIKYIYGHEFFLFTIYTNWTLHLFQTDIHTRYFNIKDQRLNYEKKNY